MQTREETWSGQSLAWNCCKETCWRIWISLENFSFAMTMNSPFLSFHILSTFKTEDLLFFLLSPVFVVGKQVNVWKHWETTGSQPQALHLHAAFSQVSKYVSPPSPIQWASDGSDLSRVLIPDPPDKSLCLSQVHVPARGLSFNLFTSLFTVSDELLTVWAAGLHWLPSCRSVWEQLSALRRQNLLKQLVLAPAQYWSLGDPRFCFNCLERFPLRTYTCPPRFSPPGGLSRGYGCLRNM